ncbi:MAG: NHLP bacteriocin export ABC transporter permease/ATPase subunit [bacterium]|nr:NHLP bacteriocin export ABC transporter permease/ATPase subunit [bacterium]
MAGWFEEQIKQRIRTDEENFSDALISMSGIVMGDAVKRANVSNSRRNRDAVEQILDYYHVKTVRMPEELTDLNEQLEYILRPAGIMRRNVHLTEGWYLDGIGALLGSTIDGEPVAIIPKGFSGYEFTDYKTGEQIKVNAKTVNMLQSEAICFYKPFPVHRIGIRELLLFMTEALSKADYIMIIIASLAVSLLGLLIPYANQLIFGDVIYQANLSVLIPVVCLMLGVTISSTLITLTKSLITSRIETKVNLSVQSAAMMRVLSMPAAFFRDFSSGELASRVGYIENLGTMLIQIVLDAGLTSLFAFIYIGQILRYTPSLAVAALIIILLTVLSTVVLSLYQMRRTRTKMKLSAKLDGTVFDLITGIQKIKLSGAERRAFAKWAGGYEQVARMEYAPPLLLKLTPVISTAISVLGTVVLYYNAAANQVSVADYMTFNASYGMLSGSFMTLASMAMVIANIRPVLEMVEPLLQEVPEIAQDKKVLTRVSGAIELNNVSFRYEEDMPFVLDNFSLKIRPGQYVAIVGKTGCGKTTLMRLLLGFEKPNRGAVYYDGKDLSTLDMKSLRRRIGVVLQDGKLFAGDIFSNITISAPWLTLDDAWEAARMAGIDEDIRNMPMEMHTYISEGSGGISGGQRQRLMIARAIAPKPKILMFDEATSALDNVTQKIVSDSLDSLHCTRVVIAHRLSTIKHCDRIVVLDQGRIIEDGTYDELLADKGFFAELVSRQLVD